MTRYRKKPEEIEAFQMTEARRRDNSEWPNWLNKAWNRERKTLGSIYPQREIGGGSKFLCLTNRNNEQVWIMWGQYIIKCTDGSLTTMDADYFNAAYEKEE